MNESVQPSTNTLPATEQSLGWPSTLPITVDQYESLVARGDFEGFLGQVELIHGRIVHLNPQGPKHSDPIDMLMEWSIEQTRRQFTVRVEKPIIIPNHHSCPEPDIVWVTRRRYVDRHPLPAEIHLLIEVSLSSIEFDRTEKLQLYAASKIPEYWLVDVASRSIIVHRNPVDMMYSSCNAYASGSKVNPLCLPEASLEVSALFLI